MPLLRERGRKGCETAAQGTEDDEDPAELGRGAPVQGRKGIEVIGTVPRDMGNPPPCFGSPVGRDCAIVPILEIPEEVVEKV